MPRKMRETSRIFPWVLQSYQWTLSVVRDPIITLDKHDRLFHTSSDPVKTLQCLHGSISRCHMSTFACRCQHDIISNFMHFFQMEKALNHWENTHVWRQRHKIKLVRRVGRYAKNISYPLERTWHITWYSKSHFSSHLPHYALSCNRQNISTIFLDMLFHLCLRS